MSDTDAFFTPAPTSDARFEPASDGGGLLTFPSALVTPHIDNNSVAADSSPREQAPSPAKVSNVRPCW